MPPPNPKPRPPAMLAKSEDHPVEPEWIDVTTLGSAYEEQLDLRAKRETFRHRPRAFTGDAEHEWRPGRAPGRP